MTLASINLENMEFYAFHGCYKEEQRVGNRFRVDLEFTVDASRASDSDSIGDTVSYLTIYELVRDQMMITSHILEHVAKRILDTLGAQFPEIISAKIRIAKLSPPLGGPVQGVSVTMEL